MRGFRPVIAKRDELGKPVFAAFSLLFIVLIPVFTALPGCGDPAKPVITEKRSWQIPVTTVQEEKLADLYTAIGSVTAAHSVVISSRISSYIRQLPVQEGQRVKAGDVLAMLDDKELNNQIRQARAAVKSAQAVVVDAADDLQRFSDLLTQGSISEAKVRKARLQKATAEESLAAAEAALALIQAQRQYIQIHSPTDGIVTRRHMAVGDLATPGTPLLTVETREQLKFETFVAESQLANIAIGDPVELHIDNFDPLLQGQVAQIVYAGDPLSRSYKLNIRLPVHAGLYTGMFGRAVFTVGHSYNITIPPSALVKKGGLEGVYVVDDDDRLRFRWLRIRRRWPEALEVAAGLRPGEQIAERVPRDAREGDAVIPLLTKLPTGN